MTSTSGWPGAAASLLEQVAALLERGTAPRLVPDLCALLSSYLRGPAELWLVDYRQQVLRSSAWTREGPADTASEQEDALAEQPVDGSWLGRCFAGQVPLLQPEGTGYSLLLPLSSRGDRHGVLELHSPTPVVPSLQVELELLAPLVAQALSSLGTVSGGFERSRRQRPLTVAAELQWSLLPGTAYTDDDVSVAGMLEPAYSVAGDAFDWTRDEDVLHLAVLDGNGRGIPATLATTLAVGALRNARFAGVPLADQAALADQAVYAHHGGETFVSALLFQFDVRTGRALVVDAGSPHVYRVRDGRGTLVELDAQLPLGMFEETIYSEQDLGIEPGDRLVIVSDGVHASPTRSGGDFSAGLLGAFRDCRLLSAAETARHLLRELHREYLTESGFSDDALVVCLDWHPGRT